MKIHSKFPSFRYTTFERLTQKLQHTNILSNVSVLRITPAHENHYFFPEFSLNFGSLPFIQQYSLTSKCIVDDNSIFQFYNVYKKY